MTDSTHPVFYALAQARFNTVSRMDKYIPDIQDLLRHEGFPHFDTRTSTQIQLPPTGMAPDAGNAQPGLSVTKHWFLSNAERDAGFIITQKSISFQTTCYQTREKFLPSLLRGLEVINKVVHLDFVTRLGLRYLNAIQPVDDEPIEKYIDPAIHGVKLSWPLQEAMYESRYVTQGGPLFGNGTPNSTPNGTLIARVNQLSGALAFPPDLQLYGIRVTPRFLQEVNRYAVLDTDHFSQGQAPLEYDRLDEELGHLHHHIKQVFERTTTEHARKTWKL